MVGHLPKGDTGLATTAVAAVDTAIQAGMLPELKAIADSGRLENPQDLIDKLSKMVDNTLPGNPDPAADQIGYRREVEQAAEILRHDPRSELLLDGAIENPNTRELEGSDILDIVNKDAYQLKSVSGQNFVPAINVAVTQLNGGRQAHRVTNIRQKAPPGYRKIALIYLEPGSDRWHQYTREEIEFRLKKRSKQMKICDANGNALVDRLVLVNARGAHIWNRSDFGALGLPC
ncbi:hypothetical protein ACFQ0D_13130 [Micromonospora zhanjiangensis]